MAGRRDFHGSKRTPGQPLEAYPKHPLKHPPNDSGIPKHKLLGQGGIWGMFQRYVGILLEWSFNHTSWQASFFFCSVWLCENYCTFTNQSRSNDFAFIFFGVCTKTTCDFIFVNACSNVTLCGFATVKRKQLQSGHYFLKRCLEPQRTSFKLLFVIRWFLTFYHGKSALNHHLGCFFCFFPTTLSKSK